MSAGPSKAWSAITRCPQSFAQDSQRTGVDRLCLDGRRLINISFASSRAFSGIRAGDIDGNGRTDLIIGEEYASALVVYFNTNGANFTRRQTLAAAAWGDARVFDYDGGGRTDLLRHVDGTWQVLQSNGSGFIPSNTGIAQEHLQLADVNGGLRDAVVEAGGNWAIRLNLGGRFGGLLPTGIDAGDNARRLLYAQVIDFNSDGREDFLSPFDGQWRLLLANPTGARLDPPVSVGMPDYGYHNGPQIGGFNGDSFLDVALDYGHPSYRN